MLRHQQDIAILKRLDLLLVRLQRPITLQRQLLRPLRILLQQIMRLREPHQPLDEHPVVRDERLDTFREAFDRELTARVCSHGVTFGIIQSFKRSYIQFG